MPRPAPHSIQTPVETGRGSWRGTRTAWLDKVAEEDNGAADVEEDEGDLEFMALSMYMLECQDRDREAAPPPHPDAHAEENVLGPDGHGGYRHVCHLVSALVELHLRSFVTPSQVANIRDLWLKAPVALPLRHKDRSSKGRFKTLARNRHSTGLDSLSSKSLHQTGHGGGAPPECE
ncbi:uncharacterized protein LOC133482640 isoform X2 [Phyllopteryx taeniolatus]|uniref:uncharacterized protein LOC133482640 isoform X2 n=1 Tax=Phyllopteryx taeniolatus TaxID=161469 RepID=UPI002AD2D014|nr:uncharacterized protein LOC133482640 isoform X2 [Phyllopteryx taeniolatus]